MTARARQTSAEALNSGLVSPLTNVANQAWRLFVDALMVDDDQGPNHGRVRPFNARSHGGGLGCFSFLPKRLVEIKVLKEVLVIKGRGIGNPRDRMLIAFLANPIEQYKALVTSLKLYDGTLAALPAGMTRSGALALHHRLGPKALEKWAQHQSPSTTALFQRANGLF